MNIVLGATGQIGTRLVANLIKKGQPVRAVVRNSEKARQLEKLGVEVKIADFLNKKELNKAFEGGKTVLLITPENPKSENQINLVRRMIRNFRNAVQVTGINRIIGLSTMGAQHKSGTGNLYTSYLLENAFTDCLVEKKFVRPAYYYSNWIGYLDLVRTQCLLPTFFPPEMKIPMVSPDDVAGFLTEIMITEDNREEVREICGPKDYSTLDIARIFADVLQKDVSVLHIPQQEWVTILNQSGFSENGVKNLVQMISSVINGKARGENPQPIRLQTGFDNYLKKNIDNSPD